jgi:hypothetical protein
LNLARGAALLGTANLCRRRGWPEDRVRISDLELPAAEVIHHSRAPAGRTGRRAPVGSIWSGRSITRARLVGATRYPSAALTMSRRVDIVTRVGANAKPRLVSGNLARGLSIPAVAK